MYAVTSTPPLRRTRATLRRAEFGFFGVVVYTRVHTPRRWGAPLRAGVLVFTDFCSRPFRTNCAMVGNLLDLFVNLLGACRADAGIAPGDLGSAYRADRARWPAGQR